MQLDANRYDVGGVTYWWSGWDRHLGDEAGRRSGRLSTADAGRAPAGGERADRRRPAASKTGKGGRIPGDEGDHRLAS
jgi:hypothetical protein